MRYQTYLFLQKIKCPVCGRIMGGKATYKKKFARTYYYYGCNECKNNIKEDYIEESIIELLDDIFEYDSIVNEFFLPMIKSKITNPKEEIEKEMKNQLAKRERIKQAYINGSFTLEEHDKEVKYVDETLAQLEKQKLKIESNNRIFRLYNKQQVNKSLKHINDEMDEAAEEFYKTKKDKEKDDGLSL